MKSVNEGLNTSVSYDLSEGSTLMHLYGTDGTEDLSEDGAEKDVSEKWLSSARRARTGKLKVFDVAFRDEKDSKQTSTKACKKMRGKWVSLRAIGIN